MTLAQKIREWLDDQDSKVASMKQWTAQAIERGKLGSEHWNDGPYPPMEKLIALCRELLSSNETAYAHCEAIALSSLLPPDYGSEGFFEAQATKSVGSGGRAYWILKESLTRAVKIVEGE